ncbi:MAG: energy-coupling factor transporter transmembrane component T family protein [Anaerolineales bacterium]
MTEMMGYQEKGTFFHGGLHTLTKMIVFLTVTILAGLWLDARYLAPLLVVGLAFNYVAKTPKKWFLVMLTALALTMLPTLRSTVGQADPEYYKVLDPAWAATNVATINTRILGLGTLGFTYGSLMWLAGRLLRFATVVTWALLFISTTPMFDIANTLYALKVPQPIVFVLQMTYRFIPYMATVMNQIQDAQKLRGWNLRTWNIAKLFRRSIPLANPIIRRAAMVVDQVTIATQIRGFGSGQITPLQDLTLRLRDKIIIILTLLFFITSILALIFFRAGMI